MWRSCSNDKFQRLAVEDISGINHLGRMHCLPRLEPSGDGPNNLARAYAIDHRALPTNQIENAKIRTRLLCEANVVERCQIGDALDDFCGVVHIDRRTKLAR